MERNAQEAIVELSGSLAACDDPELIRDFLQSLLTPREVEDVASRWKLVQMIRDGVSQRTISKELGVSLCKITRGSRELKKENSAFVKMLEIHP